MINFLKIQNFKSLRNVQFDFRNLNLLMGLNSMGKSSVIQSLLILRQSYIKENSLYKLYTNGDLIKLGNSKDIFFQNAATDEPICFEIENEISKIHVKYNFKNSVDVLKAEEIRNKNEGQLSLVNEQFHYLAADHISPEKTYKSINSANNIYNQLGNNGENAPYFLARMGLTELQNTNLHHPKAKSNWIAHELDAWMSEISPGTKILANELPGLDIVKMSVQFETKHKISEDKFVNEYTDEYSPVNVGFGIPYVLPLILSLLISNPGDLVLIENPESHLHPKGQSMIGKLIALAAQSGVQIICETHSDHIINGIRVETKNNIIANDKVRLFYFDKNEETKLETEVTTINVDKNGELDNYPEGLLDEWGNLMSQLF